MIKVVDGNPLRLVNPASETVYMALDFCYGAANEPEGKHGINHLLEHILVGMLEKRLSGISHQAVCDGLSDIESLKLDVATIKTNINQLLDAVGWLIETQELDQAIFNSEHPVILGAADLSLDPYELVLETSRKSVFKGSRFGHPPDGYRHEVESIAIGDCDKAWQDIRNECKSVLGLYGDIENAAIQFRHGMRIAPGFESVPKPADSETVLDIPGAECCYGMFVTGYDPDLMDFLGYIIGGSRHGMLFRTMREETGLAYDTRAIVNHYTAGSLVRLYFGIDDKAKLQKSCDALWESACRLRLDENSLRFQKESYRFKLLLEMDNPERLLAKTTHRKLIGLEPDLARVLDKLDSFGVEALNGELANLLKEQNFVLSKVI